MKLKEAVEAALGPDAGVRLQANLTRLEIQSVSGNDDRKEIEEAMTREEVPPDQLVVKWLRPWQGGNQYAVIEVPEHLALRLLKKGQIRVGLVYCRVRLQPERLIRCYQCHGCGHITARCARTSRRDCCLACGGSSHMTRDCTRPPNCVLGKDLGRPTWGHYPGRGHCEAYRRATGEANNKTKTDNKPI